MRRDVSSLLQELCGVGLLGVECRAWLGRRGGSGRNTRLLCLWGRPSPATSEHGRVAFGAGKKREGLYFALQTPDSNAASSFTFSICKERAGFGTWSCFRFNEMVLLRHLSLHPARGKTWLVPATIVGP